MALLALHDKHSTALLYAYCKAGRFFCADKSYLLTMKLDKDSYHPMEYLVEFGRIC